MIRDDIRIEPVTEAEVELRSMLETMDPLERFTLCKQILGRPLSPKQQRWVDEYVVAMDERAANKVAGKIRRSNPAVEEAIQHHLELIHDESLLKAEYVREYILDILELCPTDYFTWGPKDEWMIDPEQFKKLPRQVKRLVDSVETRIVQGVPIFKVNFISKQAALVLAAKYTLTQKVDLSISSPPWEQLAREAQDEARDPIEDRLNEYRLRELPRSVSPEEPAVAGSEILQQTT